VVAGLTIGGAPRFFAFDNTGAPISGWGANAQQPLAGTLGALAALPGGDVAAAVQSNGQIVAARLSAATGDVVGSAHTVATGTPLGLAADGAGNILVAGSTRTGALAMRLTPDAAPDPGFDGGTPLAIGPSGSELTALRALPGGALIGAGDDGAAGDGMAVRLTAAGAADGTFGDGGVALVRAGSDPTRLVDVQVDHDGRPVFAGYTAPPAGGDLLLVALDGQGLPDHTLDTAGPQPGVKRVAVGGAATALAAGVDSAGGAQLVGLVSGGPVATRHLPNSPPTALFTAPTTLQVGAPGTFDASPSTDPELALRRYEWDFDGDGTFETDAGGQSVTTHAFATPGVHQVGLRVTDDRGATATTRASVTVTAAPAAGPEPQLFRSAVAGPVSGTVRVRLPGGHGFAPLTGAESIPVGSEVDATHGRVQLTAVRDATGATETGQFFRGRFRFTQAPAAHPYVTLTLSGGSFKGCGPAKPRLRVHLSRLVATAARRSRHRVIRRLWGDGHGSFRTKGRYAAATVRGTRWETVDRCDGVLLRVTRGVVTFRDLLRGGPARHVAAGHSAFVASKGKP
jgi:PKD repeat protein